MASRLSLALPLDLALPPDLVLRLARAASSRLLLGFLAACLALPAADCFLVFAEAFLLVLVGFSPSTSTPDLAAAEVTTLLECPEPELTPFL
jgi:hypothetical protein